MIIVWETMVITVIAFGILYWLLHRYAFKPLFSVIDKRREMVLGELQQAEKDRQEAARLLEEQRKAIEQARNEAKEIVENSHKVSAKTAEEIIEAAKAEAARMKESALQEIEQQKNEAIAHLRGEVGELSVKIAKKIIEKEIDEASQSHLIDQYLKEVSGR